MGPGIPSIWGNVGLHFVTIFLLIIYILNTFFSPSVVFSTIQFAIHKQVWSYFEFMQAMFYLHYFMIFLFKFNNMWWYSNVWKFCCRILVFSELVRSISLILDVHRLYPAHHPTHCSNHRANRALLMIDCRVLKHETVCKLPTFHAFGWEHDPHSRRISIVLPLFDTLTLATSKQSLYATSCAIEEPFCEEGGKCYVLAIRSVICHNGWLILRAVNNWKGRLARPL